MMRNPESHSRPDEKRRARAGTWLVVGIIAILVAVGVIVFRQRSTNEGSANRVAATDDVEIDGPSIVEPPGFIGINACAECHPRRVEEFSTTNHFHTFRRSNPETMPASFTEGGSFTMPDLPLSFELSRDGDAYFQTAIHDSPTGKESTTSTIDLILGAGTSDDVYLSWHPDGAIHELPVGWLFKTSQWGASNFDPFGAKDFSRDVTPRCLECHNTWMHHLPGSRNRYQREHALMGVTCERCHGPGESHATFHREHRDEETGQSIVRPALLSRELQIDLCTQCHSNAMRRRGPAFTYRPGTPVDESFKTLHPRDNEDDHVANQISYLRESKCFQKSDSMTCVTCHDPHRPREKDPVTAAQASCHGCHQPADCRAQPTLPEPVRADCTGCHMPAYAKMNVVFMTEEDPYLPPMLRYEHRIAVHPAARDTVLLEWYRTQTDEMSRRHAEELTRSLVEYWSARARTLREEYRFLGAVGAWREALRIEDRPELRDELRQAAALQRRADVEFARAVSQIERSQFESARDTLLALLDLKPDLARAHGRLGTVYALLGEKELARRHLNEVLKHDPDDSYGESMLGWLAYLGGNPQEALEHYNRAAELEPWNAKNRFQIALAFAALKRTDDAIAAYRRVLEIDPNHVEACWRLSAALCDEGTAREAISPANRAVQLSRRQDLDALISLSRARFESGQRAEAEEVIGEALRVAQSKNANRLPEVRAVERRIRGAGTSRDR